ncbi:hypothetical protein ACNF42_00705 [Cuniculiplasma sp. SKW3]|uniref:hypothetical protein n=1 Tax=Cuniculiplasma sp. SKW3 TaxID=3400170 RepID=UPI003FD3AA16
MAYTYSNEETREIEVLLSHFFKVTSSYRDGPVIVVKIEPSSSFADNFQKAIDLFAARGFNIYNNGDDEIIVARKYNHKGIGYLKFLLLFITVISIFYAGYTYGSSYYTGQSESIIAAKTLLFFLFPVGGILLSREIPKYIIRVRNGQKYSMPIFVPNPILMGTLGIINAPDEPYKSSDQELFSGFYSLISGLLVSMLFLSLGYYGISLYHGLSYGPNSSINLVNLPIFFQVILGRFLPAQGNLDLLALAGWSGLIFTSFNAFPVGFLDGASIFAALSPSVRKNISYVFLTIIAFIDLTYPVWLILPLFILLIGLDVQEPMNTKLRRVNSRTLVVIVVTLMMALVGLTPFPVHISSPSIEVSTSWNSAVILNNSTDQSCFQVSVTNVGQIAVDPGFYISNGIPYDVRAVAGDIDPGGTETYYLTINGSSLSVGINTVDARVYVNSMSQEIKFTILKIIKSYNLTIIPSPEQSGKSLNLTVISTFNKNVSETMFISAPENLNYSIIYSIDKNTSIPVPMNGTGLQKFMIEAEKNFTPWSMNVDISTSSSKEIPLQFAIYDSSYIGDCLTLPG